MFEPVITNTFFSTTSLAAEESSSKNRGPNLVKFEALHVLQNLRKIQIKNNKKYKNRIEAVKELFYFILNLTRVEK